MTSDAHSSAGVVQGKRSLRPSLSFTDVMFVAVLSYLAYGHLQELLAGNVIAALFVLQQIMFIVFTLLHRPASSAPVPWTYVLLAWGGTLLPLAMRPTGAPPNAMGGLLVVAGAVLATGAVLSLGRSFGIEAANRGIQTRGLYRFVRHPIYAAYLPLMGGFLLAYLSWWNAVIFVVWMACQVGRIRREEALLGQDVEYQVYAERVRWRLIPGAW